MKIAFVSFNQEKLPDPVVPLGVLCIMGNTPSKHLKELWDLCFENTPELYLKQQIERFRPELIAVSIRNIQNNDYSDSKTNLTKFKRFIDTIRAHTTAPIIIGGSGFSVMPQNLMRYFRPDFGIYGEGEGSFQTFLRCLGGDESVHFAQIPNFLYWSGEDLLEGKGAPGFLNIDEVNGPAREYADPRYFETAGINNVQTKRGCPMKCTYCTYPIIEGKLKRMREPILVADEMQRALDANPGTTHFFVVDAVFNQPPHHAKKVCRELIQRNWKTPWTCYINPLGFDEELAELMKQAGAVGFEVGSDSGSDDVLKLLKKGFLTKDIVRLHEISERVGLKDCHTFILGTPGETHEHVEKTLEFVRNLDPVAAILMAWVDDYESLDAELAEKRQVFRNEIIEILKVRKEQNQKWVIPPLSYNFDERLFTVLRRRNMNGPLWQHL